MQKIKTHKTKTKKSKPKTKNSPNTNNIRLEILLNNKSKNNDA